MRHTYQLVFFFFLGLCLFAFPENSIAQSKENIEKIREQVKNMEQNAYKNKINFFFGRYWNSSRSELKAYKINIKNMKASGKIAKAEKMSQSSVYSKAKFDDLQERAFIASEYGVPSVDYVAFKGYDKLIPQEKIFIEMSIFRSLSGPIANKIGYKKLLTSKYGQDELRVIMHTLITEYEKNVDEHVEYDAPKLSDFIEVENEEDMDQESKMTHFCLAATKVFDEYAERNADIAALELGGGNKIKTDKNSLSQMSCPDKRIYIKKMMAKSM